VTLNLLARVTDMRDHKTGDHIERTTEFVRIIAEYIYQNPQPGYTLTQAEVDEIVSSAKLHDLGKIATPDSILLKKGDLTEEEFAIIREHPIHGEELLGEFNRQVNDSFLNTACEIAYAHHEKWDGTGYPQGLRGKEIPFSARIVAIADVYDALISERPYKRALSHEEAAEIIIKDNGTHFDPYLVRVFEQCAHEYAKVADGSMAS
jgi:putative two-component system response regulator